MGIIMNGIYSLNITFISSSDGLQLIKRDVCIYCGGALHEVEIGSE